MPAITDAKTIAAFDAAVKERDKVPAELAARLAVGADPITEAQRRMLRYEGSLSGKNPMGQNFGIPGAMEVVGGLGIPFAKYLGEDYEQVKPLQGLMHKYASEMNPKLARYVSDAAEIKSELYPIRSGANTTITEAIRNDAAQFPVYGDTPEVVMDKSRRRSHAANALQELRGKPRPFPNMPGLEEYTADAAATSRKTPSAGATSQGRRRVPVKTAAEARTLGPDVATFLIPTGEELPNPNFKPR